MQTVAFLTAVDPARAHHLAETSTSVHAAVVYLATRNIEASWVVAVDGPGQLPRFRSGEHTRLVRLPARSGVAAARNLALFSTRAEWVLPLDADDTLNAAGLADVLDRYGPAGRPAVQLPGLPAPSAPETDAVQWVVADHSWHGRTGAASKLARPVALRPGQLADHWAAGWPSAAANLLVRREAALSVAGWPALPVGEDVAFALALSEHHRGVLDPVPVWRRRQWEGQLSATPEFRDVVGDLTWGVASWLTEQRRRNFPTRPPVAPPQ